MTEHDPKRTVEFLLGEISSKLAAVESQVNTQSLQLTALNGKIDKLPCEKRGVLLESILEELSEENDTEIEDGRVKKKYRRDFTMAIVTAVITALMTACGVHFFS